MPITRSTGSRRLRDAGVLQGRDDGYFANVAADSGLTTNVYSSDTQYSDGAGHIAYSSSFGGRIVDTNPYPASGCPGQGANPCLTDAQLQTEIDDVVAARHLPRGLGAIYYVFTPSGVDSCFDNSSAACSHDYYCAYHSYFAAGSGTTLYADQPYGAVPGCDPGKRPNGTPADATINVVSHENNETITDPTGLGWFDASGNENGDKCNFNFGGAIAGSGTTQLNQQIGTGNYWLQREWSNQDGGCVQREAVNDFSMVAAPTTGTVTAGSSLSSTISTALISGSVPTVTLSAAGLPSGATASFGPPSVGAGVSSTLTINTMPSTPAGNYSITVSGAAASGTHKQGFALTVVQGMALFTSPTSGQTGVDTTKPFTWSTIAGAQNYYLTVGTSVGAFDLANSGELPASQSSYNVPVLPTGQTLYGRIYTKVNGSYSRYQDITFHT